MMPSAFRGPVKSLGSPFRKIFKVLRDPIINEKKKNGLKEWSSRISLNTVCLAQVGLVNAVHFGKFDTPSFKGSCRFLVVRSKRLAVPAPSAEHDELR